MNWMSPNYEARSWLQFPDDRCVARDALRSVVAQVAIAEPDLEAHQIEKLLGGFLIHLRTQRQRIVLVGLKHGRYVSEGEGLTLDSWILREVGARSMKEPAVEDEAVTGRAYHLHLVRAIVLVRTASALVAAGHDEGRTVFGGEVVQHPKDVAHDARHQRRPQCIGLSRTRACDRPRPHRRLVIGVGRWNEPLVRVQPHLLAANAHDDRQEVVDTDFLAEHVAHNVQNVRPRSHLAKDLALVRKKVHILVVTRYVFRTDRAVTHEGDASLALGLGLLADALARFGKL